MTRSYLTQFTDVCTCIDNSLSLQRSKVSERGSIMETTRTTTFLSHTKRLRTVMAAAVVSLGILVSGSAWAGKVSHQDVIVNVWTAYGTTYGARHAPSDGKFLPEQYIGCSLLAGIAGGAPLHRRGVRQRATTARHSHATATMHDCGR